MLHPVFQEDELTLIIVGAVLGLAVGYAQLVWDQRERAKIAAEEAASLARPTSVDAGGGGAESGERAGEDDDGSVMSWYDSGQRL